MASISENIFIDFSKFSPIYNGSVLRLQVEDGGGVLFGDLVTNIGVIDYSGGISPAQAVANAIATYLTAVTGVAPEDSNNPTTYNVRPLGTEPVGTVEFLANNAWDFGALALPAPDEKFIRIAIFGINIGGAFQQSLIDYLDANDNVINLIVNEYKPIE